jgi:hypothetical protein
MASSARLLSPLLNHFVRMADCNATSLIAATTSVDLQ